MENDTNILLVFFLYFMLGLFLDISGIGISKKPISFICILITVLCIDYLT